MQAIIVDHRFCANFSSVITVGWIQLPHIRAHDLVRLHRISCVEILQDLFHIDGFIAEKILLTIVLDDIRMTYHFINVHSSHFIKLQALA